LFSANADDAVRVEPETSIMAALDGRLPQPAASRPAWTLWGSLGAAAVVAGLTGWWWRADTAASAPQPVAAAAPATGPRAVVRPAEPAPAVLVATAPLASASTPTPRAVVEEIAVETKALAQVAAQASSAPAVVAVDAPALKPRKGRDKAAASVTREPGHDSATAPASARRADAPAVQADATDASAPNPVAKDADVELLAALMRYSDQVGATGAGKGQAQGAATRMNELTIADVVKRCKALGGDEAARCKKRICSGYWGKAEACPAKQAPTASKPKKSAA
jgi:hypothetical protein